MAKSHSDLKKAGEYNRSEMIQSLRDAVLFLEVETSFCSESKLESVKLRSKQYQTFVYCRQKKRDGVFSQRRLPVSDE